VAATLIVIVFAYVGSYFWRSTRGRYEPAAIGLNGVKWYRWAPRGFVTDLRWNHNLIYGYYPLFFLDTRLWHTDDARDRRYPIHEVATEGEHAKPRIEVFKAKRELQLFDGEKLIKTYRIALGANPKPPKEREGDKATPEGAYFICRKNPKSQFHLSL
jgi:hypothetical protein